uniref:Uncharacterized protein n=1 Tax=Peronospora matthiolae TaxID=2874970 RepID=A0AAV1T7W6_9STRA
MGEKTEAPGASPPQRRRCRLPLMLKLLLGAIGAGVLMLLLDLSMINESSIVPVEYLNAEMDEGADFYPDEILESKLGDDVRIS